MKNILVLVLIGFTICSYSQKEKLILNYNDFKIYKDTNQKTYKILSKENLVIKHGLKYVNYAGNSNSLQVLDKKNNLIYFDNNLKTIKVPKDAVLGVCGTVAYFEQKIIERNNNYYIEFTEDKSVYSEGIKKSIIDTIPKHNIKAIYFANSEKQINYDENFYFPSYLILDFGDKFAIKDGDSIKYFDSIDLKNPFNLKVKKNNLVGYYNTTKIKYKSLENFEYNLAKFEDKHGNIGYIDLDGNEYK